MKQHYIPRCYLMRFSDNARSIFTYDKKESKSYTASLMSVCCEDDIYSISDEFIKQTREEQGTEINRFSIEKDHFSETIEPLLTQYLRQLDEIKDEWESGKGHYRLNFYEKRELALHIVTQYFRMPQIGEAMVGDRLRMERAQIDMIKHIMSAQTGNKEFEELKIDISCEKPVLHANISYLDKETLMLFADAIAKNIFVFWISKGNDFYTSDFPISVEPHDVNVRPLFMGLSQPAGELMMALSPGLSLSVYDKAYFKEKEDLDCSFVVAEDKEIRRQNMIRYFYATRHVFSLKNDFRLIEFIYNHNNGKHIFMAPNLRSEIISGLGRY